MKIFRILFLVGSLYNFSIYSQNSKVWKTPAKSFLSDLMTGIDSTELYNSVNFRIHRDNNLKKIFSETLIKYFYSKSDTLGAKFNNVKRDFFYFFDLGDLNVSFSKEGFKIYLIKFNTLNDTSDLTYIIYDKAKEEIGIYESKKICQNNKNENIELIFDKEYQSKFLEKLIDSKNEFYGNKALKCYTYITPLTNNKLLSMIYYYKDSITYSDFIIVTFDIKNNKIYW